MQVKSFIESVLNEHLQPVRLDVLDESYMHNVPSGAQSHWKVTIVSDAFTGLRLIQRHRRVNELLSEALEGPVHALSLHTFTSEEWEKRGESVAASPECRGGE
ncbi:BolA/IbaG family iron-sulfur metabolism protein [Alteromonas ponticola]|uniref:BolA/IbaG family iron-sulfur metabolism protein n=1 Tax=Alteromonas aquimaris TaxID=2998417 RepID=A0ABT3P9B7_9ALTE|nr:BolA/IbaG family iron-sulfur metabolism protein [Alteromonas aquimaris]MCW8109378.1 BolA/IbaG family iron-sulfur metabolism protein [Alteromonas aquimaris]